MKGKLQILLSCLVLATGVFGSEKEIAWQSVDQLCGQVQSVKDTKRVIRQKDGRVETLLYETPIPNAKVVLYRTGSVEDKCCNDAQRKAETTSGRVGNFIFRNMLKGRYWLVVTKEKQRYEMPLLLTEDYNHRCDDPNSAMVRIFWMDAVPHPKIEIHVR